MDISTDELLLNALRDGIRDAVKAKLTQSYDNPAAKLIEAAVAKHNESLRGMLDTAIGACVNDAAFREQIAAGVRSHLAKTLVNRFGGELEKQVNVLKSDPATRARITLAIEDIVKQKAS